MTPSTAPAPSPWRRRLRVPALFAGAVLFLVEEWLWVHLGRSLRWIGKLRAVRWAEARIARLPPAIALVVLLLPVLILFPFKIAGLWLIGTGRFFSGCALMLAAKVLSTAVVARIFIACRPQLMTMDRFARLHAWMVVARDRVHRWIEARPAWQSARRAMRHLRSSFRRWTHRRRPAADGRPRPGVLMRWRHRRRTRRQRALTVRLPP